MFEFVESDGKGSENNIPCSSHTTVDNIQGTSVNTCFVRAEVHQVTHHQLESIEEENTGNPAQKESIRSCSNSRTNPNNDKRERCAKVKKENDGDSKHCEINMIEIVKDNNEVKSAIKEEI